MLDFDLLLKEVIVNPNLNSIIISSAKKKIKNSKKILNSKRKRTAIKKKLKPLKDANIAKNNGK